MLQIHHGATFPSYPRGVVIHEGPAYQPPQDLLIQPVRANAPCSHTSAHEALPAELERIFDASFTFAACAHYLVKMAS